MATINQLVKIAKIKFVPFMEEKGFVHHGKLEFSRSAGDGVYQLILGELSYGENLKFRVTCFVPEFDIHYMEQFPKKIPTTCGGRLGEGLVATELWDVSDLAMVERVFDEVVSCVKRYALPWFDEVNSRMSYVDALYPHLREKIIAEGKVNEILAGS